jgi:hypothetical protein
MSFRAPPLLAALLILLGSLITNPAMAWVEQTVLAHDARVVLMRSGTARVQHTVKIRVKGGPLRTFDIHIADRDVTLSGEPTLVLTGGAMDARMPVPVAVEQRPDGPLRVDIDQGNGVRRGVYDLVVTYDVDLLKQNGVTRDGSLLLLSWIGPRWDDGIDNMRTTFAVPSSGTDPRAVGEVQLEGPNDELVTAPLGAFLSTLTRLPEFDELELVRPHVASGEAVAWKVRVDPSVLGEVQDPRLKPPPPPEVVLISPERRATYLGIGGAIAVLFSVLLTLKHHQVVQSCRVRGVRPRPVVPVGVALRMAFAGPLLAASVGAQVFLEHPLPGALGVLAVALLAAYRTPVKAVSPRGPGRWLPLSDEDAFGKKESWPYGWLDAGSPLGKAVFVLVTVGYGVGVWLLSRHAAYFAYVAALDFAVVVVLFGTGRRTELPADAVHSAAPLLREVAKDLRKSKKVGAARVRGLGRIPTGATDPDELRLVVRPKGALQGFRAIEVGVGWAHGIGGPVPLPQVLLRVVDGSPCHEAVTKRLRKARWVRGRESYERVMVLTPAVPTLDMTVKLAESLSQIVCTAPIEQTAKVAKAAGSPRPRPRHVARRPAPPNKRRRPDGTTPMPPSVDLGEHASE